MTRSGRWMWCLPFGVCLVAPVARGQEPTSDLAQVQAVAESIVVREETLSERAFDPVFRVKAKELLAALPIAELVAQTGDNGLGLNALGDTQADLVYTPVTPCRIFDTRYAGGPIAGGTTRSFLVTGTDYSAQGGSPTGCGIPYGPTTAAVINFAVVKPAGPGNVRVTPYGQPIPNAAILNFTTGVTLANGLAVATCNPASATCTSDITIRIDVNATDLAADVQGYFQRVARGGVGTALLADAAVTAPKISSGVVVRSLNSQTDTVTLAGSNGLSVTQGSGTVTVTSNATPKNTASSIVARDSSGDFSASSIVLVGDLRLPNTTSATVGLLTLGGTSFLHDYGTQNTFVGSAAGNFALTGTGISAFGFQALAANTNGSNNSAFGSGALESNTAGYFNSGFGYGALKANTDGNQNSAFGYQSLAANTGGDWNSAFGHRALGANTTASYNSAFGQDALEANTTGTSNAAFGYRALGANTTADYNSAFGSTALYSNTTGSYNSSFGCTALFRNTAGSNNAAFGYNALDQNTTGDNNSAFGTQALRSNTTGYSNFAFGHQALRSNTTGHGNTAFGGGALSQVASGDTNIAVGMGAGVALTSGSNNIYVANVGLASESNTIRIGTVGTHTATYIAGIYGSTSGSGAPILVNSSGQLGTTTSSRRYKEQIADMEAESDVLLKLRPVSFYYRPELDETHLRQYGLVAEEVAEVAPGLVEYDKEGAPQTVRYHFVNAMLLNEVQKQRRRFETQDAQLRAQDDRLRAQDEKLDAQESLIRELKEQLARLEARLAQ